MTNKYELDLIKKWVGTRKTSTVAVGERDIFFCTLSGTALQPQEIQAHVVRSSAALRKAIRENNIDLSSQIVPQDLQHTHGSPVYRFKLMLAEYAEQKWREVYPHIPEAIKNGLYPQFVIPDSELCGLVPGATLLTETECFI